MKTIMRTSVVLIIFFFLLGGCGKTTPSKLQDEKAKSSAITEKTEKGPTTSAVTKGGEVDPYTAKPGPKEVVRLACDALARADKEEFVGYVVSWEREAWNATPDFSIYKGCQYWSDSNEVTFDPKNYVISGKVTAIVTLDMSTVDPDREHFGHPKEERWYLVFEDGAWKVDMDKTSKDPGWIAPLEE